MTVLFYAYYVAEEWVTRVFGAIKDWTKIVLNVRAPVLFDDDELTQEVRQYHHHGADEGFAEELNGLKDDLRNTTEIWLDDEAMSLHEELARLERQTVTEFNGKLDEILATFSYDATINPKTNPMASAAKADIIPWREKIADTWRATTDQVQQDCREVTA